jgi:hypothetical protein
MLRYYHILSIFALLFETTPTFQSGPRDLGIGKEKSSAQDEGFFFREDTPASAGETATIGAS